MARSRRRRCGSRLAGMVGGGTRALVLSGGGPGGAAWMLGFIDGLRRDGVDLGEADLVVGTSAGAPPGAQPAPPRPRRGVELDRRPAPPPIPPPAHPGGFAAG